MFPALTLQSLSMDLRQRPVPADAEVPLTPSWSWEFKEADDPFEMQQRDASSKFSARPSQEALIIMSIIKALQASGQGRATAGIGIPSPDAPSSTSTSANSSLSASTGTRITTVRVLVDAPLDAWALQALASPKRFPLLETLDITYVEPPQLQQQQQQQALQPTAADERPPLDVTALMPMRTSTAGPLMTRLKHLYLCRWRLQATTTATTTGSSDAHPDPSQEANNGGPFIAATMSAFVDTRLCTLHDLLELPAPSGGNERNHRNGDCHPDHPDSSSRSAAGIHLIDLNECELAPAPFHYHHHPESTVAVRGAPQNTTTPNVPSPSPNLIHLRHLWLVSSSTITSFRGIEAMECLESVNLSRTPLHASLRPLQWCRGLRTLILDYCSLNGGRDDNLVDGITGETSTASTTTRASFDATTNADGTLHNHNSLEGLERLTLLEHLSTHGVPLVSLSTISFMRALKKLDVSGAVVVDLQPLAGLVQLESLRASCCRHLESIVSALPVPDESWSLPSLRSLDLSGCPNLESLAGLEGCPELGALNVSSCQRLTSLAPLGLSRSSSSSSSATAAAISRVYSLNILRCTSLSSASVNDTLQGLSFLETLSAGYVPGITSLQPLATCQYLKDLQLEGAGQLRSLDGLASLWRLEHLNINRCCALTSLEGLPTRRVMRKRGNDDGAEEEVVEEKDGIFMDTTERLQGKYSALTITPSLGEEDESNRHHHRDRSSYSYSYSYSSSLSSPRLRVLQCGDNTRITSIAPLQGCTQLETLHLNGCVQLRSLAGVEGLPSLLTIVATGTRLFSGNHGEQDVAALFQKRATTTTTTTTPHFDQQERDISDQDPAHQKQKPLAVGLRMLMLSGGSDFVSDETAAALRKALPNAEISLKTKRKQKA